MVGARAARDELVAALYQEHRPSLVRLGIGLVGDRGEAEELVQDAFAVLLRRWSSLHDVAAAPTYLRAAVVNGARARWRRRRVRELALALWRHHEEATDIDVAERSTVLAAVAELPMRKRACVLLRYYVDLTERETAEALGVSVGTVKSQTAKALRQLAGTLEPSRSEVQR